MHRRAPTCGALGALLTSGCVEPPSQPAGETGTIVPAHARSALGRRTHFSADLTSGPIAWSVLDGSGRGFVSSYGVYYAPLSLPDTPLVEIVASTPAAFAVASVQLVGVPADTIDCFGDGELDVLHSENPCVFVDDLPEALVRAPPVDPPRALEAGVSGTVMVDALVCACGDVLTTRVRTSIPLLDAAAVEAVRQWRFLPGRTRGEPVAVWVAVPVRFVLHAAGARSPATSASAR